MVVVHPAVVEAGEDLLGDGLDGVGGDDVVPGTVVQRDGDRQTAAATGGEGRQIEGRRQQDEPTDGRLVLAGIQGGHQSAVTGANQDEIRPVSEQRPQLRHPFVQVSEEVLDDHVGIAGAEINPLGALARALQSVDENADRHCSESFLDHFGKRP